MHTPLNNVLIKKNFKFFIALLLLVLQLGIGGNNCFVIFIQFFCTFYGFISLSSVFLKRKVKALCLLCQSCHSLHDAKSSIWPILDDSLHPHVVLLFISLVLYRNSLSLFHKGKYVITLTLSREIDIYQIFLCVFSTLYEVWC